VVRNNPSPSPARPAPRFPAGRKKNEEEDEEEKDVKRPDARIYPVLVNRREVAATIFCSTIKTSTSNATTMRVHQLLRLP
jgi:hypothetical protein